MPFAQDKNIFYSTGAGDMVVKSAKTASGQSEWFDTGAARELVIQLQSDAGAGTTPALDVRFQTSFDGTDATAIDVPTGSFTQVVGAASAQIKTLAVTHRYVKAVWTIAGTTPSFNFGVYATARR